MRRKAKTDDNQAVIVRTLRNLGCTVQSLAAVGQGCPDILVGRYGKNYLFEIKDPGKAPSARRLTDDEGKWHRRWRGQVKIIESWEECLKIMS